MRVPLMSGWQEFGWDFLFKQDLSFVCVRVCVCVCVCSVAKNNSGGCSGVSWEAAKHHTATAHSSCQRRDGERENWEYVKIAL